MWKVRLPETGDIDEQLDAALIQKNGTKDYDLSAGERQALHELYARYDELLGEPDASLQPAELQNCADAVKTAYGQVQIGGRLAAMRDALLSAVLECPLCGSGPARTLDHHLPQDEYRALSVNPRNLVPSCQPCNRAKGTLESVAGQGMVHAYFQAFPQATFLIADVTYDAGSLEVAFSIDENVVGENLAGRLRFQLERLKLNERHPDAINIFLFASKPAFEFLRGKPGERDLLRDYLLMAAQTYDRDFGVNHWRAAVMRGLAGCDDFLDDPWTYLDQPPRALAGG